MHKTDLIHYLTGQRIVKTSAVLATRDKKRLDGTAIDVDDNAIAIYTLENGAVGVLCVSWTNYGAEVNATQIYCTNGVLRLYDDAELLDCGTIGRGRKAGARPPHVEQGPDVRRAHSQG